MDKINISKLKYHPNNPRQATDVSLDKLINSLLARPNFDKYMIMLYDSTTMFVYSGNLRLKAFRKIAKMSIQEIEHRIKTYHAKMQTPPEAIDNEALHNYWSTFLNEHKIQVENISHLSESEKMELLLKSNSHYGDWDTDILSGMDYDLEQLDAYGINPFFEAPELDLELQDNALREASNNDFFSLNLSIPKELKPAFDAVDKETLTDVLIDYVNK